MNKSITYIITFFLILVSCKRKDKVEELYTNSYEAASQVSPSIPKIDSATITEIKFNETDYNYGSIPKDSKVHHYFVFTNVGDKPLTITNVNPSCGCTVPEYPTKPVMPQKKDSIMLEFNSQNFSGEIHKSATVNANIAQPIILKFSGNIKN